MFEIITANLDNFYKSLSVMGQGMLGIFVVILVIYAMVRLLVSFFPEKK